MLNFCMSLKSRRNLTFKHINRYFWAATVKNSEFVLGKGQGGMEDNMSNT